MLRSYCLREFMLLDFLLGALGGAGAATLLHSDRIKRIETRLRKLENAPQGVSSEAQRHSPVSACAAADVRAPVTTGPTTETGPSFVRDPLSVPAAAQKRQLGPRSGGAAPHRAPTVMHEGMQSLRSLVLANPFASLGVLLVLAGIGFLFALLDLRSILPPAVRVLLVALAAVGAFAAGMRQERQRPALGLNLQGGALAAQYLCALWAYQGYGMVSAGVAFLWMGLLSSAAVGWAVARRRQLFAFMGLTCAVLTPLAASTGQGEYAGLTLYCAWVAFLGLGAAIRLVTPALASAALTGIALLLVCSLRLPAGSLALLAVSLVAMQFAFQAAALRWALAYPSWGASQVACVVGQLLSAPALFTALLASKLALSSGAMATLLAATAAGYLVFALRVSALWRSWLLFIATAAGATALGIGLEGPARAMAFSAAAMGLVLFSETLERKWAPILGLACFALSALAGFDELAAHTHRTPLLLCALMATAAGFVTRRHHASWVYTVVAPVLVFSTLPRSGESAWLAAVAWFNIWSVFAAAVAWKLRAQPQNWPALALSALWAPLSAMLYLLAGPVPGSAGGVALRETLLLAGVGATLAAVLSLRAQPQLRRIMPSDRTLAVATLIVPAAVSLELLRQLPQSPWLAGSLALVWAVWTHVAARASLKLKSDFCEALAAGVATAFTLGVALLATPQLPHLLVWPAVGLLVAAGWANRLRAPSAWRASVAVFGVAMLCQILQLVAAVLGVHSGTLVLLVTREMQPAVSLLWAATSVFVVLYAAKAGSRKLWSAAGLSALALACKMLLVDLSALSLTSKVGVFLATGIAFILLGRFSPEPPQPAQKVLESQVH